MFFSNERAFSRRVTFTKTHVRESFTVKNYKVSNFYVCYSLRSGTQNEFDGPFPANEAEFRKTVYPIVIKTLCYCFAKFFFFAESRPEHDRNNSHKEYTSTVNIENLDDIKPPRPGIISRPR